MTLAVILAIGESWEDLKQKGQDALFLHNNLSWYRKTFKRVYVFSYGAFYGEVLPNVFIIPNKYRVHRFLYMWLMPVIHKKHFLESSIFRGMQLTSILPLLITKYLYQKKTVINYGYDYEKITLLEGKPVRAYILRLIKYLLRYVDEVIVTTIELGNVVQSITKNVVVIPNGVDIKLFKNQRLPKKYDLMFVGRLEKQKNLGFIIQAAVQLQKNIRVLFIGTGSQLFSLKQLARKLSVHLTIIEKINNIDLPRYYNQAKIFILPSQSEGLPKVLLEAMSCSLAVIGTDVSGTRTVIRSRQNGILIPLHISALVYASGILLTDSHLRNRLGRNARKTIESNYAAHKTWQQEISLLTNLARS